MLFLRGFINYARIRKMADSLSTLPRTRVLFIYWSFPDICVPLPTGRSALLQKRGSSLSICLSLLHNLGPTTNLCFLLVKVKCFFSFAIIKSVWTILKKNNALFVSSQQLQAVLVIATRGQYRITFVQWGQFICIESLSIDLCNDFNYDQSVLCTLLKFTNGECNIRDFCDYSFFFFFFLPHAFW